MGDDWTLGGGRATLVNPKLEGHTTTVGNKLRSRREECECQMWGEEQSGLGSTSSHLHHLHLQDGDALSGSEDGSG